MSKELTDAVEKGDLKKVKKHLFAGDDPNFMDPETGESPIDFAIKKRDRELFGLLRSYGAQIHMERTAARDALIWACEEGWLELVKHLLAAGIGLNFHQWGNSGGPTPLIIAAKQGNLELVDLLVQHDARVNQIDWVGHATALVAAIASGNIDLVRFLIKQGADVDANADTDMSMTPLMKACDGGRVEAAKLLIAAGATIDLPSKYWGTALHFAARHGHVDLLKLLISHGADVDTRNEDGKTPLICAAEEGHADALEPIMQVLENHAQAEPEPPNICKNLDDMLANLAWDVAQDWINDRDNEGRTPLIWASINGHQAVVRILVQRGADIYLGDESSRGPLRWACMRGHRAVAKFLLTPMEKFQSFYCGRDHPLAKRDAIVLEQMGVGLSDLKSVFDEPDAFMWSCFWGHYDLAKLFLKKGAEVNTWDGQGRTPLILASSGSGAIFDYWNKEYHIKPSIKGRERIVDLLIGHGANLDFVDSYGMSALMWASCWGLVEVVNMLLEAGANLDIVDRRGNTAIEWATAEGRSEVVERLRGFRKSVSIREPPASEEPPPRAKEADFFPIAYQFRLLSSHSNPVLLYLEQLRLAENILAFVGSIVAAFVTNCSDASDIQDVAFWRGGLSPGDWKEISLRGLSRLDQTQGSPFALTLCGLWATGKRKKITKFGEALDFLISLKNDAKHDRGPRTEDEVKNVCKLIEEKLRVCLHHMTSLTQFPIRRVEEQDYCSDTNMMIMKTFCYSGDHPALPLEIVKYPSPLSLKRLYLETEPGQWITLYPFLSAQHCRECKQLETFFIDRWDGLGKPAILKSFERGHSLKSIEVGKEMEKWLA